MTAAAEPAMKLCMIIVPREDSDRLMSRLVEHGFPGTAIGSTGGFLRRGSATVLSAVPAEDVAGLIAMLHKQFPERTASVPVHQLPYWEEHEVAPDTVDVRVGGAVLFVLNIDRFERV